LTGLGGRVRVTVDKDRKVSGMGFAVAVFVVNDFGRFRKVFVKIVAKVIF
jgi:hypothetical protein